MSCKLELKSIRILIVLLGLILFSDISHSQTYFSKRYDILNAGKASFSNDILETDKGYIVSFNTQAITTVNSGFGFLIIDSLGNISKTVLYEDPSYAIQTGFPSSLFTIINDSLYACIATKMQWIPEGRYDRGWLLNLDKNMDTLWTRTFTDEPPHDTSIIYRSFRRVNDGGYIVVGLLNPVPGNGLFRIGMFRLDSNGNLLWKRKYGSGNINFQPTDVSTTSDNGFIIGAAYQPAGTPNSQGCDAYLVKVDSLGNQEWQMNLGSPICREEFATVSCQLDGTIQVGTEYSDTCWDWSDWKARIYFLKIRNDKSIVWEKKYGFPKKMLTTYKVKTINDGDVIGSGFYLNSSISGSRMVGWIIRTDSTGNEKWYREFILLQGNHSDNYLYNVIPTRDYGFAACGWALPLAPDTGTQDSWVLKVDSLGCESPGNCWVGLDEIWVKEFTPQKPFVVYPNPVTDKLTIEFHTNAKGADIKLYSLCMQLLSSTKIAPNVEKIELDVGHLERGVYLLSVEVPQNAPIVDKIIKR